jgi:hypothetical protein
MFNFICFGTRDLADGNKLAVVCRGFARRPVR